VTNGLGLFALTAGSLLSSRKDKADIMDKIKRFREEIIAAKNAMPIGESAREVEKIENEFSEWAEGFIGEIEGKVVERQITDILLKETEINLSKKWRHLYHYVFEV
jgi:hypothetical protein